METYLSQDHVVKLYFEIMDSIPDDIVDEQFQALLCQDKMTECSSSVLNVSLVDISS